MNDTTQTEQDHFEDTSIFEGITQFKTSSGETVRAIDENLSWGIYLLFDGAFIRNGSVTKYDGDTPLKIWERYERLR